MPRMSDPSIPHDPATYGFIGPFCPGAEQQIFGRSFAHEVLAHDSQEVFWSYSSSFSRPEIERRSDESFGCSLTLDRKAVIDRTSSMVCNSAA